MTTSFNSSNWSAYMNVRADGTIALRLPPVAGHCPTGKTVIFNFDADGITKCVEALYNHNDYVKTPFKKRLLPANFVKNMRGTKA